MGQPEDVQAAGKTAIRGVLESARELSEQLGDLAENLDVSRAELAGLFQEAHEKLEAAYNLLIGSDGVGGPGDHDGEQWWTRRLAASLPFAVIESDAKGAIVWVSETAGAMLEAAPSRLLTKTVQDLAAEGDRPLIDNVLTPDNLEAPERLFVDVMLPGDRVMSVELIPTAHRSVARDADRISWIIQANALRESDTEFGVRIASAFSQLCRLPLDTESPQEMLAKVARLSEDVCAPQSSVSVSVGPPAEPALVAASAKFAQNIDACQMSADEGPCQLAWNSATIVYSDDALIDERWPLFAQHAAKTGLVSAWAAPIRAGDQIMGVLNVYSKVSAAFNAEEMHVVEMLANAVGSILHQISEERGLRDLTQQLQKAMDSRELIEQAKGLIMGRYSCSADEAFDRLKAVSQNKNIRVRTLAQRLLDSVDKSTEFDDIDIKSVTP